MHIGLSRHGHQKGHFVDEFCLLWKDAANPSTALAMLREREWTLHDCARWSGKTLGLFLWPKHLTMKPLKFRLVVERIHRTGAARHEQLDDSLYFRWMVAGFGCG